MGTVASVLAAGILRPRQQHMMPTTMLHNALAAIATMMIMAEAVVAVEHFELVEEGTDLEPRLFFANYTSSLLSVNSTILAYALLALAMGGAAAVALYYLYLESASASSSRYGQDYSNGGDYYQNQARSAPEGMNVMNVIQWISMLQEVYEKFDYNDLECQKKLICEVMREPEYFGNMSAKLKSGFQMARYLEVLNMPDDFRELLDEYLDASERSEGQKACEEFFQCPYSIKDSVKRNFSGNSL